MLDTANPDDFRKAIIATLDLAKADFAVRSPLCTLPMRITWIELRKRLEIKGFYRYQEKFLVSCYEAEAILLETIRDRANGTVVYEREKRETNDESKTKRRAKKGS